MTFLLFQKRVVPLLDNYMLGTSVEYLLSNGMLCWNQIRSSQNNNAFVSAFVFLFTHEGIIDCVAYDTVMIWCEILLYFEFHYSEIHLFGSFIFTYISVLCSSFLFYPAQLVGGLRVWALVLQVNVMCAYIIRMCCDATKRRQKRALLCLIGSLCIDTTLTFFSSIYTAAIDITGVCVGIIFSLSFFPWSQYSQLHRFLYTSLCTKVPWLTIPCMCGCGLVSILVLISVIVFVVQEFCYLVFSNNRGYLSISRTYLLRCIYKKAVRK